MTRADDAKRAGPAKAEWYTLRWCGDYVSMLDQRALPGEERYLELRGVEDVAVAIESLTIRGAPAIGCAAAMGIALAARERQVAAPDTLAKALEADFERLAQTRPTAINLFWALARMRAVLQRVSSAEGATVASVREALAQESQDILADDIERCRAIGRAGLELVPEAARILTHCNAGALATGGYGTALGVVRAAVAAGRRVSVLADETRPVLQGARLTAWELARDEIPVRVFTDSTAGYLMRRGEVDLVLVGADRVVANGDVANKIGTYTVAVLAREHGLPFYVAMPLSSIDLDTADGDAVPIEERSREELAEIGNRSILPVGVPVHHPAFDITPARLVTAFITEKGVLRPPYPEALRAVCATGR